MMKEEIIKNSYKSAFCIEDKNLKDLIIINTKCLIDDSTQRVVYIDNNRLKDELIYYRYYGEIPTYNNILNILLPVIICNTNTQKSEEVVVDLIIKYAKYLKKEEKLFDYVLASIGYNTVIHNIIEDKNIEYEELLQNIKQRIIGFSIQLDKSQIIKFQMERIKIIQIIDKYIDKKVEECEHEDDKVFLNLLNILHSIYIEDMTVENDGAKSIKKSILSILGEKEHQNIDNIDFVLSMSQYIIKLRNYKINKKNYANTIDPKRLIKLEVGDSITDPILNKITVKSKNFNNNILNIDVESKSGIYSLKFKKA